MRSPREIYVRQLHEELGQWAPEGKLEIRGRINASRDRDEPEEAFAIATAKDARGSVLRLGTMRLPRALVAQADKSKEDKAEKNRDKNDKDARAWRQWWTKVAVRSGYRAPEIDPEAFRKLLYWRNEARNRFEFIFDTNALISGVGHWLVRMLGDRCDLVRTVVSDLEIQDKADNSGKSGQAKDPFKDFERRTAWLAASRFLERVPHDRPIWRRLDTREETALFVATSSDGQSKSAGRDTLLLRASRREILDQVPRLHRFFVTEDKNVARAALHDLPQGSVIATYANPLPSQVLHLSPHLWLPVGDNDQGSVVASNLAEFLWEALCVCAELEIQRVDGTVWRLRAYRPGANQYPSDWADPRLFIEEEARGTEPKKAEASLNAEMGADAPAAANVVPAAGKTSRSKGHVAQPEKPEVRLIAAVDAGDKAPEQDNASGAGKGVAPWPLKKENAELLRPEPLLGLNLSAESVLIGFGEIVTSVREKREPDLYLVSRRALRSRTALVSSYSSRNSIHFRAFLHFYMREAPNRAELPRLFAANDTDRLSHLCTSLGPYHQVIATLRARGSLTQTDRHASGMLDSYVDLARLLGQAVYQRDRVYDGSHWVSPENFAAWILSMFNQFVGESPMQEVVIADLAELALHDLGLSPIRFGRALVAALTMPELSMLEATAGGADKPVLVEKVVSLSADGSFRLIEVSADGLHGMRTLKKRPR